MTKLRTILMVFAFLTAFIKPVDAGVCYVTDAGGTAYDDCRTCVNLAPAVAITTIIVVAIIALAVQNSHDSSSSHSSCCCSSTSCCSCHH